MFKQIPGFESYSINEQGEVKGIRKNVLSAFINRQGYKVVSLGYGVNRKNKYIHRMLAELFIPNPNNLLQVNHKDGNKLNNDLDNLEWCSSVDNSLHAYDHGMNQNWGEKHHNASLSDEDVEHIRKIFIKGDMEFGARPLARRYNVNMATILRIVALKTMVRIAV